MGIVFFGVFSVWIVVSHFELGFINYEKSVVQI